MNRPKFFPAQKTPSGGQPTDSSTSWHYLQDLSRRDKKGFGTFKIKFEGKEAILKAPNVAIARNKNQKLVSLKRHNRLNEETQRLSNESLLFEQGAGLLADNSISARFPGVYETSSPFYRINEFVDGAIASDLIKESPSDFDYFFTQNVRLILELESSLATLVQKDDHLKLPILEDALDSTRFSTAQIGLNSALAPELLEYFARTQEVSTTTPSRPIARDLTLQNILVEKNQNWVLFDCELFSTSSNQESIAATVMPFVYDKALLQSALTLLGTLPELDGYREQVKKTLVSMLFGSLDVARKFTFGQWQSPRFPPAKETLRYEAIRDCLRTKAGILGK